MISITNNTFSEEILSRDIHEDYKIVWHKQLGKGATKDPIYLATHIKTRRKVAVKMVPDTRQARQEISLQRRCQHSQHVLAIIDVYSNTASRLSSHRREEHYLYIVLQLMEGGTLLSLIENFSEGMPETLAAVYFRQILLALSTLHQQGILHRDLKPDNILLTEAYSLYQLEDEEDCADFQLQLADFGFAVEEADNPTKAMYTPYYAAPEVLANDPHFNAVSSHTLSAAATQGVSCSSSCSSSYDSRIDLWSLGVTLYVMLSGTPPFYPETHTRTGITPCMYECIRKGDFSFYNPCWEEVSQEAKHLISGLLQVDPNRRLSLQQLLQHPWLSNISS